jgi:DNA-binding transcriptional regulator YdaS (Cro superfamily)
LTLLSQYVTKADMSTLSEHIKGQPEKPMQAWADELGVSRPHLYALISGDRQPSLDVAMKIEAATGGAVPISSWANHAAVIAAARTP